MGLDLTKVIKYWATSQGDSSEDLLTFQNFHISDHNHSLQISFPKIMDPSVQNWNSLVSRFILEFKRNSLRIWIFKRVRGYLILKGIGLTIDKDEIKIK